MINLTEIRVNNKFSLETLYDVLKAYKPGRYKLIFKNNWECKVRWNGTDFTDIH
jgi:hypothetical protein